MPVLYFFLMKDRMNKDLMYMRKEKIYNCCFEFTLDIIGGKWKAIIIYYINKSGVARYSNLKRFIPNINEIMLTRQLRELESDILIK